MKLFMYVKPKGAMVFNATDDTTSVALNEQPIIVAKLSLPYHKLYA